MKKRLSLRLSSLPLCFLILFADSQAWLFAAIQPSNRRGRSLILSVATRRESSSCVHCRRADTRRGVFFSDEESERAWIEEMEGCEHDLDEYCEVVDDFGCQACENFDKDREDPDDFRWIRLEKEIDRCLDGINDEQAVLEKIAEVKKIQSDYGRCDLYPRRWTMLEDDDTLQWINEDAVNGADRDSLFSVMQLNVLAEGLSSGPAAKKPFRIDPDDDYAQDDEKGTDYGGFSSVPFREVALDFTLRRWRILEVILSTYRDSFFDLIAMEEMDRFRGFFAPALRLFGYDGFFAPKTRSPCVRMGWYSDGCCLFWRRDKFELVSSRRSEFGVGSQVFILAILRHLATGKQIVVAVTHLKAQSNEMNEKIRCAQVEELLSEVSTAVLDIAAASGDESVPSLILGDFNADAQKDASVEKILNCKLAEYPLAIRSAYKINPPDSSFYTTWKIRGAHTARRIIDYIFYGGGLTCRSTLEVPSEDDLEVAKLPGLRYPSDHVMLAAEFRID